MRLSNLPKVAQYSGRTRIQTQDLGTEKPEALSYTIVNENTGLTILVRVLPMLRIGDRGPRCPPPGPRTSLWSFIFCDQPPSWNTVGGKGGGLAMRTSVMSKYLATTKTEIQVKQ